MSNNVLPNPLPVEIIAPDPLTGDYFLDVSKGNVQGSSMIGKVIVDGNAGLIEKDMWGGSSDMVYPVAAESWEVVSTSANDDIAGTGAKTVFITYLDDNYIEKSISVDLNGLTPVPLNSDHFRPDSATVTSSGVLQGNDGDIMVRVLGGGAPRQYIISGNGSSKDCYYTVPAGKTTYFLQTYGWVPKNEDGFQVSKFMFFGSNTWVTSATIPVYQSGYNINILARTALPEKTDARFTIKTSNANVQTSAIIELITVAN